MITRAPWQAPINKYYVIRKLIVSNYNTTANSGGPLALAIWDQDLSNTTPTSRGSGLLPLITVPIPYGVSGAFGAGVVSGGFTSVPASTMTVLGQDQLPPEYFQGGITVSTTFNGALSQVSGIAVHFELECI